MSLSGVVLGGPWSDAEVGGLRLLERMIVSLHRAGVDPIAVLAEGPPPPFRRIAALGIEVRFGASVPASGEPIVHADGALFVAPADVRRAIEARGHLVDGEGNELPLRVEGGADLPIVAHSPVVHVRDESTRQLAEKQLWHSLGSSADGVVDRWFNRPLGRPLTRLLVRTEISPNQVTLLGTALALTGTALIAQESHACAAAGALVFQAAMAFDCVDGELARVLFKESRLGQWLDYGLDQLIHAALFAAITVHVIQQDMAGPYLSLGISSIAGGLISAAVVLQALRRPPEERSPVLNRFLSALANRDFTVLIVLLALVGRLGWILWLTGTFTHVFWMIALWLQLPRAIRRGAQP